MTRTELLDLLAIDIADRDGCLALLDRSVDDDGDSAVAAVVDAITRCLGTFGETPVGRPTEDPLVWLSAFLLLTPTVVEWHRKHGIPSAVTRDTLADLGRHLAISRRVNGEFGLETWDWLIEHYTVRLFALGRLQFALERPNSALVEALGAVDASEWALAVHIPESGPLTPELVDDSLRRASEFFPRHFPDRPATIVTCDSWMLDPYLQTRMDAESNVGSFIRRFSPFGTMADDATAALYFVFRTRDGSRVGSLPRDTRLQRAVLDRWESGEVWRSGRGYLRLK